MSKPSSMLWFSTNWSPRRGLKWLLISGLAVLSVFVVSRLLAFAQLFGKLGPHAGIEVTQMQVFEAFNASHPGPRTAVIPKIIHQIFHNWTDASNNELPQDWAAMRQMCIERNPAWELKMWNVENSRAFMEDVYPAFLSMYDGYKYPIQRVDSLRYFAVRHYGGIYVDLDNGCEESLDALTYFPAFTTDGGRGALSNNIIGGQPEHPWFVMLTESLPAYNWNWLFPYATVMYASGQWYLTAIWEEYHRLLSEDGTLKGFGNGGWGKLHRVLMDGRPDTDPWVFFNHKGHGGTWGAGDDWLWRWVGLHWIQLVVEIAAVIMLTGTLCWCCVSRRGKQRQATYQPLPGRDLEMAQS